MTTAGYLWWLTLAVGFGWLGGMVMGRWAEARMWRLKAQREYRTANCSAGQFFYVLPEKEYVSMLEAAINAGWREGDE